MTNLTTMMLIGAIAAASASSPATASAADTRGAEGSGVKVEHLGINNTLVRVSTDGKYLLLPVQEANDEAAISVLVDGKPVRRLNVRLAKTKVDYTVPLTLEPYRGHDVVLNVITRQDRSSIELFGDGGRFVMTNLVFPTEPYTTLTIRSHGGDVRLSDVKIYSLSAD